MKALLYLCVGSTLLTSCARQAISDNSIGSFRHYNEILNDGPEDRRKAREIEAVISKETYHSEEES